MSEDDSGEWEAVPPDPEIDDRSDMARLADELAGLRERIDLLMQIREQDAEKEQERATLEGLGEIESMCLEVERKIEDINRLVDWLRPKLDGMGHAKLNAIAKRYNNALMYASLRIGYG